MLRLYCPGPLRPEMFSGIGALPEPATESHVVNSHGLFTVLETLKNVLKGQ
jgi:hypothetical protein